MNTHDIEPLTYAGNRSDYYVMGWNDCYAAIEADRQGRGEPVAWISRVKCVGPEYGKEYFGRLPVQSLNPLFYEHVPLYTAPQPTEPVVVDHGENRMNTSSQAQRDANLKEVVDHVESAEPVKVPSDKQAYDLWTEIVAQHFTLAKQIPAFAHALLARYGQSEITADEDAYVIDRLGKLLAQIAVIVKGPEPALVRWSYHDLPELVAKAISKPAASAEPVAWPLASKEESDMGWTLDYRFLEQVEKVASQRTDFTTSMEAAEQVLIAAAELLRAPQPAEPDLDKCAECGAEMIHVRPGKWQHPDCPQSPGAAEPVKVPSDADAKHVQDFINCDGMGAMLVEGPQYSAVVRALLARYGAQPAARAAAKGEA